MKTPTEINDLLNDVLPEPDGFRQAVLGEMLRQARGRRRRRRLQRIAPVALVCMLIAFFFASRSGKFDVAHATPICTRVATLPMNPSAIVRTTPLPTEAWVYSAAGVAVVCTERGGNNYREIDDEQLLALAAPHAGVLIRLGPDLQVLVFPNEARSARPN